MGACPSLRSAHPHPCLAALVGDSSPNPTEGVGTSLGVGNPPRQTQAAHTQLRSVPVRSESLRPSVHAVRGPSTCVGTLSTRAHSTMIILYTVRAKIDRTHRRKQQPCNLASPVVCLCWLLEREKLREPRMLHGTLRERRIGPVSGASRTASHAQSPRAAHVTGAQCACFFDDAVAGISPPPLILCIPMANAPTSAEAERPAIGRKSTLLSRSCTLKSTRARSTT